MSTRSLMVVVALSALGLAGWKQHGRVEEWRRHCLWRAQFHETQADEYKIDAIAWPAQLKLDEQFPKERGAVISSTGWPAEEWCYHAHFYHAEMARKYREAAEHPWRTPEPDPPPVLPEGETDSDFWLKLMDDPTRWYQSQKGYHRVLWRVDW